MSTFTLAANKKLWCQGVAKTWVQVCYLAADLHCGRGPQECSFYNGCVEFCK